MYTLVKMLEDFFQRTISDFIRFKPSFFVFDEIDVMNPFRIQVEDEIEVLSLKFSHFKDVSC